MRSFPVDITFLYPQAAWLLVLLPLLWWVARRPRDRTHVAWRGGVFACLILAAMQPSLVYRAGRGTRVFILDQRATLGARARAQARQALARMVPQTPRGTPAALVQLGGTPVPAGIASRTTLAGGSLSEALARAIDALPPGTGGTITLISDGRSTDAHWERSVEALVRRGIAVNTVALSSAPRSAFVADVTIAATRVGEAATAIVDLEGDGLAHRLVLSSGDRLLATAAVPAGTGTVRVPIAFPVARAGFMPLRATIDGSGGLDTVAAVQDPLRILYLGARQVGAAPLLQRLLGDGFAVDARSPAAVGGGVRPTDYPLVFLDDVPAAQWPAAGQYSVARAVGNAGTGLIAAGGTAAFGMGGYAAGPLAGVLPVEARQEERVQRPSVALAIVVDSSGSMDGRPLELAKQIARQTVRKLTPADWVGVIEFYGNRQWAVPVQRALDTGMVERAIGRLQAHGQSDLYPAIQEAYFGLLDVDARYKHILVISDGGVSENRYQQLLRHIAGDRINVSTALVGGDMSHEDAMALWARLGQGRFYSVPDEFSLVALDFNQPEIKPDPAYRNGRFAVTSLPGAAWWNGAGTTAMPPLAGYARVRGRPEAQTLLATTTGDPVLTNWQYGRGRVTALATEPLGAGTAPWRGWRDYGRWLARVAAITARQQPDMDIALTRRFDRLHVSAQRLDGRAGTPPVVRLIGADGRAGPPVAGVEERAPGLFVADLDLPARVPALVEIGDGPRVIARAADRAFSDQSLPGAMPARLALPLAELARMTGGWHRPDAAAIAGPYGDPGTPRAADLWPWLSFLTLLLYLGDIFHRRRPRPFQQTIAAS